ncbi:hypothetical protein CCR75_003056 [Bremia lactucae]|uniref:Uncharacterized protein n=1 Tax=Bremia lactucae TaxID=4779 RepID=A0A976IM21_BRELC|nr:hypothetical protein CCR75_003056 [Bremia lactucae]
MFRNEWEAPFPVWIESIDIDEELPELMVTYPDYPIHTNLSPISTPEETALNTFLTFPTPVNLHLDALLDGKFDKACDEMRDSQDIKILTEPVLKPQSIRRPSISPAKNNKPATISVTESGRRLRHKINVDPIGRDQRRKDKQRGYEKGYRNRMKIKRGQVEAKWIQLEIQIRTMLARRTSVVAFDALKKESKLSTVGIRLRYMKLLQEERALRESNALDCCFLADSQALTFYGGGAAPSRTIREQLNGLPNLRMCHTFEFTW